MCVKEKQNISSQSFSRNHVTVASEPERTGVFLTRSCVHVTDISCGVVYEPTSASLVLFPSYCYVVSIFLQEKFCLLVIDLLDTFPAQPYLLRNDEILGQFRNVSCPAVDGRIVTLAESGLANVPFLGYQGPDQVGQHHQSKKNCKKFRTHFGYTLTTISIGNQKTKTFNAKA